MWRCSFALSIPGLAQAPDPEGFWILEDLTPAGLGATLRFSSNGQVQATSGVILKLQWKILEKLEDGHLLTLINPYRPDDSSSVELRRVDWGEGMMILRSTTGGMEATLKLVSKGLQGDDPEFLGRWTGSVDNVATIWDFTDDGLVWMRSPSRIEGDKLVCDGRKKNDKKTFLKPDAAIEKAMTLKPE